MGMDYDDLLKILGEFGRYQKIIFAMVCLAAVPSAFNNLTIVFLAAVPTHHCNSPSAAHLNLSWFEYRNLTAPKLEEGLKTDQCHRYDRNYSGWQQQEVDQAFSAVTSPNEGVTSCIYGWLYDKTVYTSTIVTEWDLVCDKKTLVPTTSSIYMAGLMVGVVLFGFISDNFGRRIAVDICIVLVVIFAIAIPFANNYIAFVAFRFILAMANMGLFTTAFVIGIEMVGPKWRVFTGIVIEYFWALGYMLIAGIAFGLRDWRNLALAISIPQALLLILIFVLPESPRWLYSCNKHEKAEVIVRKMAKVNKVELPDKMDIVVKKNAKAYVWDLFRYPRLRWRTLNIFFNWFVNSLVYYGLSLNTSNLGGNDYVNFLISAAVEIPAYAFCQFSLPHLGRRPTLAGTMVTGGVALLLILSLPTSDPNSAYNQAAIALAMIGKFCISASFAIIYVFSAEIFPTVVRNIGVGSGSFFARVGGIVAPYIGSLIDVSKFIPYIVFGALSIAAGLLSLLLPETKGHQLPETIEDGENFPPTKPTTTNQVDVVDKPTGEGDSGSTQGHANPAYESGV